MFKLILKNLGNPLYFKMPFLNEKQQSKLWLNVGSDVGSKLVQLEFMIQISGLRQSLESCLSATPPYLYLIK